MVEAGHIDTTDGVVGVVEGDVVTFIQEVVAMLMQVQVVDIWTEMLWKRMMDLEERPLQTHGHLEENKDSK